MKLSGALFLGVCFGFSFFALTRTFYRTEDVCHPLPPYSADPPQVLQAVRLAQSTQSSRIKKLIKVAKAEMTASKRLHAHTAPNAPDYRRQQALQVEDVMLRRAVCCVCVSVCCRA